MNESYVKQNIRERIADPKKAKPLSSLRFPMAIQGPRSSPSQENLRISNCSYPFAPRRKAATESGWEPGPWPRLDLKKCSTLQNIGPMLSHIHPKYLSISFTMHSSHISDFAQSICCSDRLRSGLRPSKGGGFLKLERPSGNSKYST